MEGAKDLLTNPDYYSDMEYQKCNGTMKQMKDLIINNLYTF